MMQRNWYSVFKNQKLYLVNKFINGEFGNTCVNSLTLLTVFEERIVMERRVDSNLEKLSHRMYSG